MRTTESQYLGQELNVNIDMFRKSDKIFIIFLLVYLLCDIASYI